MAQDQANAVSKVMEMIKEHSVEYVDFRFTDPRGKWQHTAQHVSTVDEEMFADGVMFDGSSIGGWKAINESDMVLLPDPSTAVIDPFTADPTLVLVCDILDPTTMQMVEGIDAQIVRVFENLKAVAEASGGSLADTVKLNVYLTDLANFAKLNEIMAKYFTEPYPARAAVGVAALPRGALQKAQPRRDRHRETGPAPGQ